MKLNELAKPEMDAATEADLEWEATLRLHANDGTFAAIGDAIKEEFEAGKTEPL